LVLVCPDDELAAGVGLVSACGVGLGDVDAPVFLGFLGFLLVLAVGVWLGQLVLVAWLVAVLALAELAGDELAEVAGVGVPLPLALALALALAVALAPVLAVELLLPEAGLVGELGGGVGELGAELDVLAAGVGEAGADDGEQDEATVGRCCFTSVLAPTPPP
jgi:hypothetical protein